MKSVSYFVFGLNHQSAPVSIREAFEMNPEKMCRLYTTTDVPNGTEWIVFSTCNRTEVLLVGSAETVLDIQTGIESLCGPWPKAHSFVYENEDAIRHVFEMTSGLRSQILGDAQILGQVKDAYRLATEHQTVGPRLHRLMHKAFASAKQVISSTALGSGGTSIAQTAVNTFIRESEEKNLVFADLSVLVLGGGDMGARILKELSLHRPASCFISNRTNDRAERLAERYGVTASPWADRCTLAANVDVVFSTTGADDYVIKTDDLNGIPSQSPTAFIDISVPRNVDPAVSTIPGYTVMNIDQLSSNNNGQSAVRRDEGKARQICNEHVQDAMGWENQARAVAPAVRTLHETFETIRRREVDRNLHRFSSSSHEDVERLTRSIMQKLIAIPIVRLKALAESDEDLAERIELLGGLFDKGGCEE